MSKRSKQLEKEGREEGLTPTKDLEVDESGLTEEQKGHYSFPWLAVIIIGVLSLIVIGLTIAILVMQ